MGPLGRFLLFQELLNVILHLKRSGFCRVSFVGITFVVDQEFLEIPTNIGRAVVIRSLWLDEGIYLPRIRAVDVCFFKEDKFFRHVRIKLFHEFQDVLVCSWLLRTKLIAWKSQDFEPARAILVGQLWQLGVADFRGASFRRYVDGQDD